MLKALIKSLENKSLNPCPRQASLGPSSPIKLEKNHKIDLKEKTMQLEKKIIDRKQMEERLRESEEKYRLLVNNLPGVVYKG